MSKLAANRSFPLRRTAELVAAGVGLFCCVATSDGGDRIPGEDTGPVDEPFVDDVPPPEPIAPQIEADLFIHNSTDREVVVNLRELDRWVDIDCDVVARAPGELLAPELFGTTRSWTLPPDANLPVRGPESDNRACVAVWVEGAEIEPSIVFWRNGDVPIQTIDGDGLPEVRGGLILGGSEETRLGLDDGAASYVFAPALARGGVENCEPVSDAQRLEWSSPVPSGELLLESLDVGLDGCMELGLADPSTELPLGSWYLCASADAFPFVVGDRIEIDSVYGTGSEGIRVDSVATSELPTRSFLASRGSEAPAFEDATITFAADERCASAPTGHCGTVARNGTLSFDSPSYGHAEVSTRDGAVRLGTSEGPSIRVQAYVAHERDVLNTECASGADTLGPDMELTITVE